MKFTTRQAAKPLSFAEAPAKPMLPPVSVRFSKPVYTLDVNQVEIDFDLISDGRFVGYVHYAPCEFRLPDGITLKRAYIGKPKHFTETVTAFSKRCQALPLSDSVKESLLAYFKSSSDCFVNECTMGFIRNVCQNTAVSTETAMSLLDKLIPGPYEGSLSIPGRWSEKDRWSTSNGDRVDKLEIPSSRDIITGHQHESTLWDKGYDSLKKELQEREAHIKHIEDCLAATRAELTVANKTISALSAENNRMCGRKTRISCDSGLDD